MDLACIVKPELPDRLQDALSRSPGTGKDGRIDLSCNAFLDSKFVQDILGRKELATMKTIELDLSSSGVSPEDIVNIALIPRVTVIILHGLNLETSCVNEVLARLKPRRAPLALDLAWNCLNVDLLVKASSAVTVQTQWQFKSVHRPVAHTPVRSGVAEDLLLDKFFRRTVGFAWSDLVLGSDSALAPERTADAVIRNIAPQNLAKAFQAACPDEDAESLPKLRLVPFGSRVNGFGSIAGSDVDLVVVPADKQGESWFENRFENPESQKKFSQSFLWHLRRLARFKNAELVKFARIPVIKIDAFALRSNNVVSVDITCMNGVCLLNSQLIKTYAKMSESVFRLGHFVKLWAKRNSLISGPENEFALPTSYAWILLCCFFVQERLSVAPCLVNHAGSAHEVWGCKNAVFATPEVEQEPAEPLRQAPRSPVSLFSQFLHFVAEEAEGLNIDLRPRRTDHSNEPGICVIDPIEVDRNVTKNVVNWSYIRETCWLYLDRIERVKSVEEFLLLLVPGWTRNVTRIDTVHDLIPF